MQHQGDGEMLHCACRMSRIASKVSSKVAAVGRGAEDCLVLHSVGPCRFQDEGYWHVCCHSGSGKQAVKWSCKLLHVLVGCMQDGRSHSRHGLADVSGAAPA